MLAKIHLRTACGCTQTYFQRIDMIEWLITKPLRMSNLFVHEASGYTPWVYGKRNFKFIRHVSRSYHRVELWYEEVASA